MNKTLSLIAALFLLFSCKKEAIPEQQPAAHPQMKYTDLADFTITQGKTKAIDLDGNGSTDFRFRTTLVGDPVLQRDRLLFEVTATIDAYLLNNEHEETPPLNNGDRIDSVHQGFEWNDLSTLTLAEKQTFATGEVGWDGIWKTASHKFLPLYIKSNGQIYFGWIELSFDKQGERIILHKAAISVQAGKAVKAGY